MQSLHNSAGILFSKILSFYYSAITRRRADFTTSGGELPAAPADFLPVLRFAVCSDIHIGGSGTEELRLKNLIDFMYTYSSEQSYNGFDALCIAGDFTNRGKAAEYDAFNGITADNLKAPTRLLVCTGNHEYIDYRDYDASLGARMFEKKLKQEQDSHIVINGFHFILTSYCEDGKTFKAKLKSFDESIRSAVADSEGKPVFVFQHPAPHATLYGSVCWGDRDISKVFRKYPDIIDFSGHSHYPINDPRSVWQNKYTALGCGTLSYFETDLDGRAGNFPYETKKAAQFYIVEADKDGNVRILPYDLITDSFFKNEYYFAQSDRKSFPYSFAKMKSLDPKPYFEPSAKITAKKDDEGETVLTFEGAKDKFIVESYKVTVTLNAIPYKSFDFSGKYMYLAKRNCYELNLGKPQPGKRCTVYIKALNAYAKTSETLKYKFITE